MEKSHPTAHAGMRWQCGGDSVRARRRATGDEGSGDYRDSVLNLMGQLRVQVEI